jgi:hypothetical protein
LGWAHGLIDPIKRRLRTFFRMWVPGARAGHCGCSRASGGGCRQPDRRQIR